MKTQKTYHFFDFFQSLIRPFIPERISDDSRMPYAALMVGLMIGLSLGVLGAIIFTIEGFLLVAFVSVMIAIFHLVMMCFLRRVNETRISLMTEITVFVIISQQVGYVHLFGLRPQFQSYILLAAALLIIGTRSSFKFRLIGSLSSVSVLIVVSELFESVKGIYALSESTMDFFHSFNYSLVNVAFFFVFLYFYSWIEMSLKETKLRNLETLRLAEIRARFLATMAHELRTPLNGISGITEMMLEAKAATDDTKDIKTIYDASMVMASIIDDLLEFSKIDSGNSTAAMIQYHLYDVLKDVILLTTTKHRAKIIDVIVDIDPMTPSHLVGDPLKLRQVLVNLLDNAFKYTFEGSVSFQVSYALVDRRGYLSMIVSDTGIGIKKELQPYVFDVYTRMDLRRKAIEGLGLGLAITKRYVDMMEGTITMESTYGKGSSFVVQIPSKQVDEAVIGELKYRLDKGLYAPKETMFRTSMAALNKQIGDINVLVVDDNRMNIRIIESFLSVLGARTRIALSGEEAIQLMREHADIDLLMTDVHLSDMDFKTYINKIKRTLEDQNPIPIILMTGDSSIYDEDWDEGFIPDAIMIKPLSLERTRRIVLSVLTDQKQT